MGDPGAAGATGQTRWPTAQGKYAGSAERDLLCPQDGLPMGKPAQGPPTDWDCLLLLQPLAKRESLAADEHGLARASAGEGRPPGNAQCRQSGQSIRQDDGKRGCRGYDGGKKVKGRKRHLLVDTLGLVLRVLVTEADVTDRDGGRWLLTTLGGRFPRLNKVWVDGGYSGLEYAQDIHAQTGIVLDVVEREPGQVGFKVLPRRWVVERTFSWLGNYRRLSKDYEYWVYSADAMIYAAMVHLMTRRLARTGAT